MKYPTDIKIVDLNQEYLIAFDNETTGLSLPQNAPLADQPSIIEFAGVKLRWDTLEEVDELEFICKPPKEIEPVITNITGLTNDDLADKLPFAAHLPTLQQFFFGTRHMVAHNIGFDRDMISYELRRLGKIREFPWPIQHHCTIEASFDIEGKRQKLVNLHQMLIGEPLVKAHRAMNDVRGMVKCIRVLREQGRI